jgi:hypothetical protein
MEKNKTVEMLLKLKKINAVYQLATEEQRGRLIDASQKLLSELEAVGFERSYLETLLVSGKDFIDSLMASGEVKKLDNEYCEASATLIFGR